MKKTTPKITPIDLHFNNTAGTIAVHLFETQAGLALIESGPQSTIVQLKQALHNRGATFKDVKHVLLTHIHLDHCAGAWELAAAGATVYAHPIGIPHLADPSKLITSATRIYQDQMQKLWGTMRGIPSAQLRTVTDNEVLSLGGVKLRVIASPGHASHHHAYFLEEAAVLFAGDAAGVKLGAQGGILPPAPPPELDFKLWHQTLTKLSALNAQKLYLAHFAESTLAPQEHLAQCAASLHKLETWMQQNLPINTETERPAALASLKQLCKELINGGDFNTYEVINPSYMTLLGLERCYKKHYAPER